MINKILFPLKRSISITFALMLAIAILRQSADSAAVIIVLGLPACLLIWPSKVISHDGSSIGKLYNLTSFIHLLSLIAVAATILSIEGVNKFNGKAEIPFFLWFITASFHTILFLYAVPTKILPIRHEKNIEITVQTKSINTSNVRNHLDSIASGFNEFQKVIDSEKESLDTVFIQTKSVLEKQLDELNSARIELEKQKRETEYYKSIGQLSKTQQSIFLKILQKNKKVDYWIGFLLGILASLVSSILIFFLQNIIS